MRQAEAVEVVLPQGLAKLVELAALLVMLELLQLLI
jgi:hypothetical protein